MKYFIIAGEASGDLHGSELVKVIKTKDKNAEIKCWGGNLMQNAGAELLIHYRDIAVMGWNEVIKKIFALRRYFNLCKRQIVDFNPDKIIFIDYPGFNLRLAKYAHNQGFETHYYISPKVWAWKESRVQTIKKYVDQLYVIFPFEKSFYKKQGLDVNYVGNTLKDIITEFKPDNEFRSKNGLDKRPIIAIIPGSRKQEISSMLPIMCQVQKNYPNYQFVVSGMSVIGKKFYKDILEDLDITVVIDNTYNILSHSFAALVTSGTATLETAFFKVPQVVCYKTKKLSYWVAKQLVKVKYISLVNIILDKEVVKELIQDDFNEMTVRSELDRYISGCKNCSVIQREYDDLFEMMGEPGAAERTIDLIMNYEK